MKIASALASAFVVSYLAACAPGTEAPASRPADEQQEAGLASKTASVGSLKLTIQGAARFESRNGQRVLVVTGSANRDLESAFSWVPDDAFGETTLLTKRKLEIVLRDGHEINSILSGLPINLSLTAKTGQTKEAYARIALAPAFARFTGSSSLQIDKPIRPIFIDSAENNLRYRGQVSATSPIAEMSVFTDDNSGPVIARVDADTFRFDWEYAAFALAADPHTEAVHFSAELENGKTRTKHADIDVLVTSVDLTTDDPYEAWPTPPCEEAVYWCVVGARQNGQTDLGDCGDYREVSRCAYATHCEYEGPVSFALEPFDATDEIEPAQTAYNQACNKGGTWCSAGSIAASNVPECLAEPATLEQVLDYLQSTDQDFLAGGAFVDRAGLEGSTFFSSGYSSGGPGLLLAIDVTTGGGEVQAYLATSEVPCHNCTDFADYAVLFYPLSQTVVVIKGSHGYDS
jgi:hypothetical protein